MKYFDFNYFFVYPHLLFCHKVCNPFFRLFLDLHTLVPYNTTRSIGHTDLLPYTSILIILF